MYRKLSILFLIILIIFTFFKKRQFTGQFTGQFEEKFADYMHPSVSHNGSQIYDIPPPNYITSADKSMIKSLAHKDRLDKYFDRFLTKDNISETPTIFEYNMNSQKTWENRIINLDDDLIKNYQLLGTSYPEINKIVRHLFDLFKSEFIIYKFGVTSIYMYNKNKIRKYGILLVILKQSALFGYTMFFRTYVKNNKVYIDKYEYVGDYYTDDLFLRRGFIKNYNNIDFLQPRRVNYIDSGFKYKKSDLNYKCFDIKNNNLLRAQNRSVCVSSTDFYGKPKRVGVWDKPCEKNDDCYFYKANKNYTNKYGGCKSGYCELPNGMHKLGYKYYKPRYKPICWNCGNKFWYPFSTEIYNCCDAQKKNKNLKSPDYSFTGDVNNRINYFLQRNADLSYSK